MGLHRCGAFPRPQELCGTALCRYSRGILPRCTTQQTPSCLKKIHTSSFNRETATHRHREGLNNKQRGELDSLRRREFHGWLLSTQANPFIGWGSRNHPASWQAENCLSRGGAQYVFIKDLTTSLP